jgi:tRNA A37 threonylcarbamoyladenosine dehydratase
MNIDHSYDPVEPQAAIHSAPDIGLDSTEVDSRFQGVENLYGEGSLEKLKAAHVCVIGLGGVGSWAAEAVVRTGVGEITLVDFDDVCITNANRQSLAMNSTVGKLKADVLKARFLDINPRLKINIIAERFDQDTCDQILLGANPEKNIMLKSPYSCVIDAIDSLSNKVLLLAECWKRGIHAVSVGATGGRKDLSKVMVADLNQTIADQLLAYVRRRMRERFETPDRNICMNIPCVFSKELVEKCEGLSAMDCNTGMGTATAVTGSFGFLAADAAIRGILFEKWQYPYNFREK